ncbi:MAG: translation initiation factor IF-2 N-terminal domain-containing protein, partial [Prevotellaceae bacterium]|nr:translation initiation factor IF-2 N-terminal domain-containing protein [Prevotellaceae bacterium]
MSQAENTVRLNKVTREFNLGLHTIVEFLTKKGIEVDASPNAKISEDTYALIAKEFGNEQSVKDREAAKKVAVVVQKKLKEKEKEEEEANEPKPLIIKDTSVFTLDKPILAGPKIVDEKIDMDATTKGAKTAKPKAEKAQEKTEEKEKTPKPEAPQPEVPEQKASKPEEPKPETSAQEAPKPEIPKQTKVEHPQEAQPQKAPQEVKPQKQEDVKEPQKEQPKPEQQEPQGAPEKIVAEEQEEQPDIPTEIPEKGTLKVVGKIDLSALATPSKRRKKKKSQGAKQQPPQETAKEHKSEKKGARKEEKIDKAAQPAARTEKPEAPAPVKKEVEFIPTTVDKLEGPKFTGEKIDLSQFRKEDV